MPIVPALALKAIARASAKWAPYYALKYTLLRRLDLERPAALYRLLLQANRRLNASDARTAVSIRAVVEGAVQHLSSLDELLTLLVQEQRSAVQNALPEQTLSDLELYLAARGLAVKDPTNKRTTVGSVWHNPAARKTTTVGSVWHNPAARKTDD